MKTILILNGKVINENQILEQDIFVKDGKINNEERNHFLKHFKISFLFPKKSNKSFFLLI